MNAITGNVTTTENLPIFMCLLIDSPESGLDCSPKFLNDNVSSACIKCRIRSDYLSGESVNDYGSVGHTICLLLWLLTIFVGVLGTLGNILIITILNRRSGSNKGFDFLLKVLAYFDTLCCMMSLIASTGHVIYLGNWMGRGQVLLYFFYLSWIFLLFGRSASQCMTVAITVERFLVITFPFRSSTWFTSIKTKLLSFSVLIYAVLLSIPRSTSRYVAHNVYDEDGYDIPSLRDLHYILRSTSLTKFWYRTLKSVHYQLDFWLPLPLLLLFNCMSFWQVRKLSARRKEMNMKQKKELQAVKMFLPVVIVLLCLNFGPISMFVMVHFYNILYREMYMATILSISLNSSVNFLIYYLMGVTFRQEARIVVREWLRLLRMDKISEMSFFWQESKGENNTTVGSSGVSRSTMSGADEMSHQMTTVYDVKRDK